jgi:predicted MFS family arabinose efflux permease
MQNTWILLALWMMTFASTSQVLIISPILPRIADELAVPEALLGTLIGAYGLMAGVFALLSGPVSDRIGRRRVLLVGTAWMAVALAAHGLANSYGTLLAVRAAAGAGGGILGGAAVAYVGDWFPYERRGWANGVVMSGFALGQVIGIPLGAVMAQELGFRSPFLAFSVFMASACVLTWSRLPSPTVERDSAPLTMGTALRKYRALLTRPNTAAAAASYVLMFLGVSLYIAYLPAWLEARFAVSGSEVAGMFLVGGVAAVVMNPVSGRLSDQFGRRGLILTSCALFAFLVAATPLLVRDFAAAHWVFFGTMGAASMRIPPMQSLLTAIVPASERGSLMSLTSACGQTGFALGGSLAGYVYATLDYGACTAFSAASVVAMGLLVWRFLPEPVAEGGSPLH